MRSLACLAVLSFAGCGGGVDCSAFSACGGALAGVWKLSGKCASGSPNPSCPQATVEDHTTTTGTVTFNSDMTFATNLMVSGTVHSTTPRSCIPNLVTACNQLSSSNTTCTGDINTSCTCDATVNQTITATGTYSTSGGNATVNVAGAQSVTFGYCVSGGTVKLAIDPSTGMATTGGYSVWTK